MEARAVHSSPSVTFSGEEIENALNDVEERKKREMSREESEVSEHLPDFRMIPRVSSRRMSSASSSGKYERPDHFHDLVMKRRASVKYFDQCLDHQDSSVLQSSLISLTDTQKFAINSTTKFLKQAEEYQREAKIHFPKNQARMEVRLTDFSYFAQVDPSSKKIKTVYNQSPVYKLRKLLRRLWHGEKRAVPSAHTVLDRINLVLKPGKMYLVLGPPSSGKTSLLKAIAGRLSKENGEAVEGKVEYNGLLLEDDIPAVSSKRLKRKKNVFHIENAISFVEQLDKHAPRLTVKETFDFAFQCRSGGTHAGGREIKDEAALEWVAQLDKEDTYVNLSLEALGLSHVADTFVGDNDVRGVSGGQRRRVTVGEMMQTPTPIFCGDEISTGLDAASTFDMINILMQFTRLSKMTRIISLLQPSPETVSLFDDVILLAEGKIIYAGPILRVESYFACLGYAAPEFMDLADFLQTLSTPDGCDLFSSPNKHRLTPYTMSELAEKFRTSPLGLNIARDLKKPWKYRWASRRFSLVGEEVTATGKEIDLSVLEKKYQNSFGRSTWVNLNRAFTIWTRDKRFLMANAVKNMVMGVSVGAVFWQTGDFISIYGVMFQGMLFIMLGSMVAAPGALDERTIFYRHTDANFYPAFPFVIGKAISVIPQAITDVFLFGTILYWMVGLAPAASNFFIFISVLFMFNLVMNQMLNIFASAAATKSVVQGLSAVILLFSMLFGGFIVTPDVIPNYYSWIYWWNPMAWAYRALIVNEFRSSEYNTNVTLPNGENFTEGDRILTASGFSLDGESFGKEWVGYSFAYLVPYLFLCIFLTGVGLIFVRVSAAEKGGESEDSESRLNNQNTHDPTETEQSFDLAFVKVTLTFKGICYDVQASKGKEKLRLLSNVNGFFLPGRMCALMGSSGAGKTTLMDVIALRKSSGTIAGAVRLNGFEQDPSSFRRCSGYVYQFDVQQPELTVRETVQFSARLRLDSNEDWKDRFVEQVLKTLELTKLADSVVGSDEEGGLTFEQKKRLSVAVELAASPSIIFLDEPTSGLDARAALVVVKSLRRVADSGRTVISTIHQPSSAVFNMFDDLLLLKKGGRVVFFGELGNESQNLVDYFEALGADPIGRGENPANWMLKVIGGGTSNNGDDVDFAEDYYNSDEAAAALAKIDEINETREPRLRIKYDSEFAASFITRRNLLNKRLQTIYWRSPTYNLSRMVISAVIGFILGSVFLSNRRPSVLSETQMSSTFGVIFISFIITGVLSITSVLPVMLQIRDVFYRQQAAGMVDYTSLALTLSVGEKWFILVSSTLFCIIFIPTSGVSASLPSSVAFWGFFTFNTAIYSYFGQCFMCLVRSMATAQILASIFIGLNNFFSGFIVRPQFLDGIFQVSAWITPGSYVLEGMIVSLFDDDYREVIASPGSEFWDSLECDGTTPPGCDGTTPPGGCCGTVEKFVEVFFGGQYKLGDNTAMKNALVLGAFLIIARMATFFALKYFRYTST